MILSKVEIKKILYATDLSETSIHAFAYAASLASLCNAGITILHVLYGSPYIDARIVPFVGEDQWEAIKKQHYQEARDALIGKKRDHVLMKEVLHTFAEKVNAEPTIESFTTDEILVVSGEPAEKILEISEKINCDLIVMGTHGHGVIENLLIGSTAKQVVRQSRKPVLVVRLPD